MTVHELVVDARGRLGRAGIRDSEAGFDAEVLARVLLGWDRARFFAGRHDDVPAGFREAYDGLIARRERREPTSYIMGAKEFWGLEFEVSPDVLIPRPETEMLVEEALACVRTLQSHVARRNAMRHGVGDRIRFVQTNFLDGIGSRVDVIVSNPPYVPRSLARGLSPEVLDFEPHVALFGGIDGLDMQRVLLEQASHRLASSGYLLMEFGDGQEDDVRTTVGKWPSLRILRIRDDFQGIPRTAVITF